MTGYKNAQMFAWRAVYDFSYTIFQFEKGVYDYRQNERSDVEKSQKFFLILGNRAKCIKNCINFSV